MTEEALQVMVGTAITNPFHQRGLDPAAQLNVDSGEQSYHFMGVDLLQSMRAALEALKTDGWQVTKEAFGARSADSRRGAVLATWAKPELCCRDLSLDTGNLSAWHQPSG